MTRQHRTPPPSKIPAWIAQELRAEITVTGKPGDRLPTVEQLAERFKVSKHSISNALELLARDGVVEMRRGWGVHIAAQPRQWRIGILSDLDLLHPRTGHYFRGLASALLERFRELGMVPSLYTGKYRSSLEPPTELVCPQFWADIEAGRLDAGVITNAWLNPLFFARCQGSPVPLVGNWTGYSLATDTPGIVTAAVRRLAEQGCRRVGLMTWELSVAAEPFRRTAAECGLTTAAAWMKGDINPDTPGAGWDEFREIWAAPGPKPDGLIILDDMLFTDAQMAIFELGIRVPKQLRLAIQANRGSDVAVRVPATVFEVDPAEAAGFLADLLMRRLRGELLVPTTHTLTFRELGLAAGTSDASRRRIVPVPEA